MLKVLFFIHDLGHGGAEKVLVNLVNNLDPAKFNVTLMSLFGGGVNEAYIQDHVRYIIVFKRSFPGNSHLLKFFSPENLHRLCIKEHYDIEVAFLEGVTTRIISGCQDPDTKLIAWFHSMKTTLKSMAGSFRSIREMQQAYLKFEKIVSVSQMMNENVENLLKPGNKSLLLYNVIESDQIRELSEEAAHEIHSTPALKIVSVGTMKPVKGYERLLSIVKRLLDEGYEIELYMLGEGPLFEEFRHYVADHGMEERVFLLGYQKNPYRVLSKCDLFVCSSYSEGFSTAVTEALILGLPVITTEVSGMKEMLGEHNEYGVVVDNNEDALYEGMKRLVSDPDLIRSYKEKAAERGRDFDKQHTVFEVEEMLCKVAAEPAHGITKKTKGSGKISRAIHESPFFAEGWYVAFREIGERTNLKDLSTPFSIIKNNWRYWAADPFLFEDHGEVYVFAELYDYLSKKGCIGYCRLNDPKKRWIPVITEKHHLSFPYIFRQEQEIYIMPESSGDKSLCMYRAVDFPDQWEKVETLRKGVRYVDTTPFLLDGRKLAITYDLDGNCLKLLDLTNGSDQIADSSLPEFKRPAGRIDLDDQIRIAQNCEEDYGKGLVFYRFTIDESLNYQESELYRVGLEDIRLNQNIFLDGMHTYNYGGGCEVIDVKTRHFNIVNFWVRLISKLR